MKKKILSLFILIAVSFSFGCSRADTGKMTAEIGSISAETEKSSISETHMSSVHTTPTPALTPQPTTADTSSAALQTTQVSAATSSEAPPAVATVSSAHNVNANQILPLPTSINDPYAGSYGSPYRDGNLSSDKMSWYFMSNDTYQPPSAQRNFDIRAFDGYYLGDTSRKVIYLTFDEGYENGYTAEILDVLKDHGVKAAFFVTHPYIKGNGDLVMRMVDEGHIVGNHSVNHKSSPDLTNDELIYEIEETASLFKELTGREMPRYFRPPMGEYSARTLEATRQTGYKTIFWSFAYRDWEVDNQPGLEKAFSSISTHVHNGCLMLLHAVSESNTRALPYFIELMQNNGFTFLTLDDLSE